MNTRPICSAVPYSTGSITSAPIIRDSFALAVEKKLAASFVPQRAKNPGCDSEIGRQLSPIITWTTQAMDVGAMTPTLGASKSARSSWC